MYGELGYAAGSNKLPDDDQLMIETFWSDFKCFSV
jgi:hypothetical protein